MAESQADLRTSQKNNKIGDEDYISYTDTHDLIEEFYLKKSAWGLENYFLSIEEWLSTPIGNKEENKPLVLCGNKGAGKKSLIVKWMEFHKSNSKKKFHDIILCHFATGGGINSNYFYAIYRLLNKLREKLDVSQKVELLEEKLRKYFGYWLEICDRIIQTEIVNDQNIILVFEGIDKFYDIDGNKESKLAFWLPRNLPPRVRVIVTCDNDSNSFKYFKNMNAKIIELNTEPSLITNAIEKHSKRELFVSEEVKQKHLEILASYPDDLRNNFFFVKVFLSTFIPYPTKGIISKTDITSDIWERMYDDLDYEALRKVQSLDDLINLVLEFYEKKIMPEQYYKDLLLIFCLCQKGLYQDEILALVPIKPEEVKLFTAIFKEFLISQRKLWYLPSDYIKRLIQAKHPKDSQSASELHEKIASTLEKSSVSIRKLEEQTYHLYKSKSYFKLKETVSIIENFLLLFNPSTKYDLCRYWQTLEENGFDPSIEYNKAIEGFEMHYHPSSEDIFRIILQVSRFLKEFSDFETHYTPEFRHPPIVGGKELDEIGLLEEIQRLNLFFDMDPRKPPPKILDDIEQLNIEIPSNKEEVRKFHMNKLEALLNELNDVKAPKIENEEDLKRELEKDAELEKESGMSEDSSKSEDNEKVTEKRMAKNHQIQIKEYPDFKKQAISTDREPTYYYYKRWLWMIFPWACLSESLNYSLQIKKCFTSATKYMSVISEKKFTQRALKIAIEAKLKKKMLYAKKDDMDSQLESLKSMNKQIRKLERQPSTINIGPGLAQIFENVPPIQHSSIQSQPSVEKKPSQGGASQGASQRKNKLRKSAADESNVFITSAITDTSRADLSKNASLPHISTSRIDQEMTLNTSKILNKSKAQKERFRYFEPDSHFLSGNEKSSVSTLPRLKDSINSHTGKELNIMEMQTNNLKKELDHLTYTNKSLANSLKEMKMIEFNQNTFTKDEETKMQMVSKIKMLEQKISHMENIFNQTRVLKIRCQKIINICKRNSHQNKEWIRNLNFLLQNYKKLIKFEQENIKATREDSFQLNKIYYAYLEACNQKSSNQSQLLQQLSKGLLTKNEFDEKFSKSDEVIEGSALEAVEKLKQDALGKEEIRNQQKLQTLNEKTNKNLSSKLEELEESYNKLKTTLGIQSFEFEESEKFKEFRRARDKKNELNGAIMEREDRILQLKQTLDSKKTYLETLRKAQAHNSKSLSNSQLKGAGEGNEKEESKMMFQNKLREVSKEIDFSTQEAVKAKQSLLDSIMIINSMCLKLGLDCSYTDLNEVKWNEIKGRIAEKVEEVKAYLPEEDMKKVDNGTFDYSKIYKKILPFDPAILDFNDME